MKEQKIKQDIPIGENIKKLRERANLTQEAVVAQMQVRGIIMTRIAYSKIEMGIQHIWVSELVALKEIFNAEYSEFFEPDRNI